jgi:hypothetical protein
MECRVQEHWLQRNTRKCQEHKRKVARALYLLVRKEIKKMKVIDNTSVGVEFKELKVGATFKRDGDYYIKTMEISTHDSVYNALCFQDGEYEYFSQSCRVIPFKCELIVL